MLYVLIPHRATRFEEFRYFSSFAAVEQAAILAARGFEKEGHDPDWCCILAYEGMDELSPMFFYRLVGSTRLVREKWPSPSP